MSSVSLDPAAVAIDMLARPAMRVRRDPGSYVEGRWVPGAETEVTIQAVIQPVTGAVLQQLVAGENIEAEKLMWTRSDVRAEDDADRIVEENGQRWKVTYVWDRFVEAGFFRAALGKEGSE